MGVPTTIIGGLSSSVVFLCLVSLLLALWSSRVSLMLHPRTVIIGSGLSGLACAKQLAAALPASEVLLCDKGRKVGGRLSTVSLGDSGLWDKGAQFFTVRSPEFAAETSAWPSKRVWCRGFVGATDGHERYIGARGMRSLAEDLAASLPYTIEQSTKVTLVRREAGESGFVVEFESGKVLRGVRNVVLTAPVIQSLDLLDKSVDHDGLDSLRSIRYDKTITVLLKLNAEPNIPEPGGWQRPQNGVHFIGRSKAKHMDERECITVHFDPAFSDAHFDKTKDEIKELALKDLEGIIDASTVDKWDVHRWRYAIPSVMHPERHVECAFDDGSSLFFCGDAFKQIAVEGSFLSGMSVGRKIVAKI